MVVRSMSLLAMRLSSNVNIQVLFLSSSQYLAGQTLRENSIVLDKTMMVLDQSRVLSALLSHVFLSYISIP